MRLEKGEVEIGSRIQMLNSTHTLVNPTPTTLERYLLEFESSMSVSFVSEYSRKSLSFLSLSNITHNHRVGDSQGIQR